MNRTQIYDFFKGTKFKLRRKTSFELSRELQGIRIPEEKRERHVPRKFKKPPLKIHCYRDGIIGDSGNLYTGVNLYFIIHGDPSPKEMDFFEAVQDWFENEIETNTGWAKAGDEYAKSSLSECDADEIESGRHDKEEMFVVEVSLIPDNLLQYYAWYLHGDWQVKRMWDDFRYGSLKRLLLRRFK